MNYQTFRPFNLPGVLFTTLLNTNGLFLILWGNLVYKNNNPNTVSVSVRHFNSCFDLIW